MVDDKPPETGGFTTQLDSTQRLKLTAKVASIGTATSGTEEGKKSAVKRMIKAYELSAADDEARRAAELAVRDTALGQQMERATSISKTDEEAQQIVDQYLDSLTTQQQKELGQKVEGNLRSRLSTPPEDTIETG